VRETHRDAVAESYREDHITGQMRISKDTEQSRGSQVLGKLVHAVGKCIHQE
jgi:hypothetical protein